MGQADPPADTDPAPHANPGAAVQGAVQEGEVRPDAAPYTPGEQGVQATSLFWHFVDVIWIILFVLLYVWQRS